MGNLTILIGISIFVFILGYICFKLDRQKHFLLQLLILFFIFANMIMLAKVTFDDKDNCDWLIQNVTTVNGTNTTELYEYDYKCSTNTSTTPTTFYNGVMWFVGVVAIYFIGFILWEFGKKSETLIRMFEKMKRK